MSLVRRVAVRLLIVALALSQPAPVAGLEWLGLKKHAAPAAPPAPYNPPPVVVAPPPGPYRHPAYASGNCPWYGYGFGVPTYSWGYFGATYRPASIWHHGYYDDFTQWGYRRGY